MPPTPTLTPGSARGHPFVATRPAARATTAGTPPRTTPTITSAPARVATIGDEVRSTRESAVEVEVEVEAATAADDDAIARATADATTTETVQGTNASIVATKTERKARFPAAAAGAGAVELEKNERLRRSRV